MYRSRYRCSDCKHEWEKMTKAFPKKDPPCPQCKQKRIRLRSSVSDKTHNMGDTVKDMLESRQPPFSGPSNFTKAMDETAKIVMEDYGMTDLRDNQKPGDTMDQRLPAHLAKRAENAWGGATPRAAQAAVSMQAVQSGAYANQGDIVKAATSTIAKRPIKYVE